MRELNSYVPSEHAPRVVLFLCALALLAFLFLEGMTSPLNHDEDHYLAGAVMARDHVIYQEFTYSAMPLHPILMGAFLDLVPVERPFLWFRGMSAGLMWIAGLLLFFTVRGITGHDGVSLVLTSFLVLNTLVLYSTNGLISCHIPALTLAVGGAYALHRVLAGNGAAWAFLCGFLFCAAAGFKLYYLLLLPVVLLILVMQPVSQPGPARGGRQWLWYCAGTLPSGLPVLFIFFQDTYAFLFNNYFFHQYGTAWRILSGDLGRISLPARIGYVLEKLGYVGNGAVAVVLIALVWTLGRERLLQQFKLGISLPLVWLILALTATVGCMLPRPMHLHYLVFPLPFYILLCASLFPMLGTSARRTAGPVILFCAVAVLLSGGRYLFQEGFQGLLPSQWVPNVVHREAGKLALALQPYPEPKQVTTLSPLLVIEAGLPFEPAFSGAAFFFRLGDTVPESTQERLGLVQEGDAEELLEKTLPAGVLLGFSEDQEEEFVDFVEEYKYEQWPEPIYGDGRLYLRPQLN